jgi:glycosyltransferase involved in cell wall biosynthesis
MLPIDISIVTICFNNLQELQDTMKSVDAQSLNPREHIIVNGSTNDEIKKYLESTTHPAYRKWINEPDKGISDAFNKGIAITSDDIIHLLNSGDMYFDNGVLEKVKFSFTDNPHIKWLHGKYLQYFGESPVISGKPFNKELLYRGMRQVGHPGMFIKKELYKKYGFYDTAKKIAMDYDFLVRIRDEAFLFIPEALVKFAPSGISSKNVTAGLEEVAESYTRIIGTSLVQNLWFLRIRFLNFLRHTKAGEYLFGLKNRNKA